LAGLFDFSYKASAVFILDIIANVNIEIDSPAILYHEAHEGHEEKTKKFASRCDF